MVVVVVVVVVAVVVDVVVVVVVVDVVNLLLRLFCSFFSLSESLPVSSIMVLHVSIACIGRSIDYRSRRHSRSSK